MSFFQTVVLLIRQPSVDTFPAGEGLVCASFFAITIFSTVWRRTSLHDGNLFYSVVFEGRNDVGGDHLAAHNNGDGGRTADGEIRGYPADAVL